jgi:pilus assembly protein CpaB
MAAYLEPGMRAMAIRVTVETAAGGFILPGDRVDVLLTRETNLSNARSPGRRSDSKFSSSTVMQNIKVLAIDQSTRAGDDEQAVVGATATLEVGPRRRRGPGPGQVRGRTESGPALLRRHRRPVRPRRQAARQSAAVRVFRGGAPEVVVVQ